MLGKPWKYFFQQENKLRAAEKFYVERFFPQNKHIKRVWRAWRSKASLFYLHLYYLCVLKHRELFFHAVNESIKRVQVTKKESQRLMRLKQIRTIYLHKYFYVLKISHQTFIFSQES